MVKGNFDTIINENRPVIVDFHALWCGPCKVQSPVLKQIADELGDRVRMIKIDIDLNPAIAGRFKIQSVPTLMIFRKGEIKYQQAGVHTKPQLMNIIFNIL